MGVFNNKIRTLSVTGTIGGALMFCAQVKPTDATSNLSAWLELLGIKKIPAWVGSQAADQIATFVGLFVLSISIVLVLYLRYKKKISREASEEKLSMRLLSGNTGDSLQKYGMRGSCSIRSIRIENASKSSVINDIEIYASVKSGSGILNVRSQPIRVTNPFQLAPKSAKQFQFLALAVVPGGIINGLSYSTGGGFFFPDLGPEKGFHFPFGEQFSITYEAMCGGERLAAIEIFVPVGPLANVTADKPENWPTSSAPESVYPHDMFFKDLKAPTLIGYPLENSGH